MKQRYAIEMFFVLSLTMITGNVRAQGRSFPDTRDGIFVFADQIPPGNTDLQNEFAATKYVGTQKMIPDDIREIRAYNPDFLHLHYQLAVGEGDSSILFIDGNQWVTDWGYVSQQDDWFVTDDEGTRIRNTGWGWYLMDPSGQIGGAGDNGWKEYWAQTCIERMRNNEADGVFADSYDVAVVNADFLDPPFWWFEGTNPAIYWVPHLDIFGAFITEQLHSEPENFYVIPNLGFQVTSWDPADYSFGDGGMIEGFGQWGGDSPFSLSDWKLQMNRILNLIALDKIMILQSYMWDALDYDDRGFYLGCYLLIKGHYTYVNILSGGPGLNMQYYPEYGIDLGPYLDEPPLDVDDLYDGSAGVYRRDYEKGIVIVNPTGTITPITLDSTHYLVVPTGGGSVDESGDYNGSLGYEAVDQVSVGAYESMVLLYQLPETDQVTGLDAFHRSGQTFITWTETADENETYHVYRYTEPITGGNLDEAELIAGIAEGSGFYENESLKGPEAIQQNFIIEDLGAELSDGTGLLVWTPNETGSYYYAVTAVMNGVENTSMSSENSLVEPVGETDDPPEPVLVWVADTGRGWVYTQFMDYAAWNPTFDGYAYNYSVGVPSNYDGSTPFALTIHMDGWGTRYAVMDGSPYDYQTIYVNVDDPHQTWYYGNAAVFDYGEGDIPSVGPVGNFTEWRILRCVDDIIRDNTFNVDEDRIYAFGGSMGGSGALNLGLRYPDVFAAVYGAGAMTDYETAGDFGGLDWEGDLVPKLGPIAEDFPIVNLGPRAEHLSPYNGTGVWDWMDHQENMLSRIGDEMPFIATAHGDADLIIEWQSQGAPWYDIMDQQARRGFTGYVVAGGDHYWYGFVGCGSILPFESYVFRKDRSFPGVTDNSLNTQYDHNRSIEWSCPWNDFAGDIIDLPNRYEMVLRIVDDPDYPQSGTIDITPRRLQAFQVLPGRSYIWNNEDMGGTVIQTGTVVPDEYNLLLIENFEVSKSGNKLIISPRNTGVAIPVNGSQIPRNFALGQAHPNPFSASTTFDFDVPKQAEVSIEIFDLRGRLVRRVHHSEAEAGRHSLEWDGRAADGREVRSGVYLIRMEGAGFESMRKVVKIR